MMYTALPPKPCPCVVLVTGITNLFTEKLPVTVVGAGTAPVSQPVSEAQADLRILDLQVVGGATLASLFGASAPRTVEFRVLNGGTLTQTPVLIGRWGSSTQYTNVIQMPALRPLAAGQSEAVRAHFSLPALSMGTYTVKVEVQAVGSHDVASKTATTSTWPILLYVAVLVLLALLIFAIVKIVRNRRQRASAASDQGPTIDSAGQPLGQDESHLALGVKVGAAAGAAAIVGEGHDPNDPTTHLE
jgi:hypothetical protein